MRISKQTITHFANKGVSVRWYPEQTYEEFRQRIWQKQYDFSYNYTKDNVRGSKATEEGRTNVLYETMEEFVEKCKKFADTSVDRACDPYEYDRLYIEYDGKLIIKKEPVKSKVITIEMIDKLIAKNEKAYSGYYGEFAKTMQQLLKDNGLSNKFSVYPTTYGIGVWVLYNYTLSSDVEAVTKILDAHGIEYYNEYSEHGWVYRYKISKKTNNISKLA